LAEGKKRPDLALRSIRNALGGIGLRLIQLLQQYIGSPVDLDGKKFLTMATTVLGPLEGQHAVDKLKTPLENAELGLGVQISATSAAANKDMEKQQLTGLLTLSTQLAPQLMQFAQAAAQGAGTPTGDVAQRIFNTTVTLMERVYEQYDLHDAEELVPAALAPMAPPPPAPAGPAGQPQPGAGGQPPAAPSGPGVATLPIGATDIFKSSGLDGA
jgi:hypothetical protein